MLNKPVFDEIAVLPVSKFMFDVFTGTGFESWTRFQAVRGHLKMVGGNSVTESEYKQIKKVILT